MCHAKSQPISKRATNINRDARFSLSFSRTTQALAGAFDGLGVLDLDELAPDELAPDELAPDFLPLICFSEFVI